MSQNSPMVDDSELVDSDSSSVDCGSQAFKFDDDDFRTNPKWAAYLSDEDEEPVPYIPIEERIRLAEEKEQELIRKAKAREIIMIPDDYVPKVRVKHDPVKEEELNRERYEAWCQRLEQIQREKEERKEISRRLARAEYEKYAKLQKEYRTRDYYWKPDPLYALHLRNKGYSKIAIDKALFYTDNTSVAEALEYLKKNPNPTELTKEEVMAAGEEVLKRIRPAKPHRHEPTKQTKEGEMEIEQASQALDDDDCSTGITTGDDSSQEIRDEPKEVPFEDIDNVLMLEETCRRGVKRNYDGEVKSFPTTSTPVIPQPPLFVKEKTPEYKMIFMVNAQLLMDAITLSLEVGKVVANLTNQLRNGSEESKKMFDEWIRDGNKMSMYKGTDSDYLNTVHKSMMNAGVLSYVGKCSHYRDVKTPSSTVIGIFGDTKLLKRLYMHWQLL